MSQQNLTQFTINDPKEYFIKRMKTYFKTLGMLSFKFYTLAGVGDTFIVFSECPADSVSDEMLVNSCGRVRDKSIGETFEALKCAILEVSSDAREWDVADDTTGEMQINFLNQLSETLNKWTSYSPYYLYVLFNVEDETVIFDYKVVEGINNAPLLQDGDSVIFGGFMPFVAVEDI